jgi:hypothetical protein
VLGFLGLKKPGPTLFVASRIKTAIYKKKEEKGREEKRVLEDGKRFNEIFW